MKLRSLAAAAAAFTLTTSPVLAQATSADVTRSAAPVENGSEMGGKSVILALLAALLIGFGIFTAADNESDTPASP